MRRIISSHSFFSFQIRRDFRPDIPLVEFRIVITPGVVILFRDLASAVTGCFCGSGSEQIPQEVSFLDICSKTEDRFAIDQVSGSIQKYGKDPVLFIRILKKAIDVLIEKARSFRPSIIASLELKKYLKASRPAAVFGRQLILLKTLAYRNSEKRKFG